MKKELFVIDDDPFYLGAMRVYFNEVGAYDVQYFQIAEEALAELHKTSPFLILLDHNLSGNRTGLEYLISIKEIRPEVPVLYMTGDRDISLKKRAKKAGAFNLIVKSNTSLIELGKVLERFSKPASFMQRVKGYFKK